MIAGLITSKDVIYYLVIIFLFVSFTILKLKDGRDSKPWYIKAGRYLAVIVIGLSVRIYQLTSTYNRLLGYQRTPGELSPSCNTEDVEKAGRGSIGNNTLREPVESRV